MYYCERRQLVIPSLAGRQTSQKVVRLEGGQDKEDPRSAFGFVDQRLITIVMILYSRRRLFISFRWFRLKKIPWFPFFCHSPFDDD